MSSQIPDLSRRKLLRMASYSSLVLLGAPAAARADTEIRRVVGKGIPPDCVTEKSCKEKPVDSALLVTISQILWTKFCAGAKLHEPEEGVFQRAFEMTGPFVICQIEKFPADGDHLDTSNCSVECGQEAAKLAQARGGAAKINITDFETAWCIVQKRMNTKLARARAMRGQGEDEPSSGGGLGCG